MVFTKYTKNDHPREGKKVVFLRLLASNTWFYYDNNAISHCFFHGVSLFGRGLILDVFWCLPGAPLDPLKPQLDHFADSWCPGRPLGSLLGPIWCSVGWRCALLGAVWRKSGHQLDDFVSLGVKFCFFWVSGLWITLFVLSLEATGWVCRYWWSRFRSRLNYILNGWILACTFLMVEYIVDNLLVSFTITVFMALLVSMHCIC